MQQQTTYSKIVPARQAETGWAPIVWLLLDDRPGHVTQVKGLAQRMGWKVRSITLNFNVLNRLPNPLLGSHLLSVEIADAQKLQSPFPDIVVGMGRRIVPVARWIKKQNRGATRIVLLGRKAVGKISDIDCVVGCVHFNQLPREGLFQLVLPPSQVNDEILSAARSARPNPVFGMRHPRIVVLVGGPTVQHGFDETDAAQMASQLSHAANERDGELAIVTSRRTPPAAIEAMRRAAPGAHLHVWQKDAPENPYLSYLAHAELLVVTGESESMISEAAATGMPLTIYPLRTKPPTLKNRFAKFLRSRAGGTGMLSSLCRHAFQAGWIVPPRDLSLMHRAMQDRRLARLFDGSLNEQAPQNDTEFEGLERHLASIAGGRT